MNGMVPPVPIVIAGASKNACDASSAAARNQGACCGECQPACASATSKVTLAPWGGSRSKRSFRAVAAAVAFSAGGKRNTSLAAVAGRSVLPASAMAGAPSRPTTARLGCHVLAITSSAAGTCPGPVLPAHGKRPTFISPRTSATRSACSLSQSGTAACNTSFNCPVRASSTRSTSWRSRRKLDGTMPPAAPE